jgi:hypothetical protein
MDSGELARSRGRRLGVKGAQVQILSARQWNRGSEAGRPNGSARLWREYSNRNSNAARIPACWSAKGACRHSSPLCQWRPACSRVPQRLADRVTAIKAGTPGGLAFVGALRGCPCHVRARRARVAVSFSRHRDCPAQCHSGSARSGAARPRGWPAELWLRWRRPRRGGAWASAGTAPISVCS